jgi:hypothetical protein
VPPGRVWLTRRRTSQHGRSTAERPWASARPYIGLTQVCQLLRREFSTLYFGILRYSMKLDDLRCFLDVFQIPGYDERIGGILKILRRRTLPVDGVDILPLIKSLVSTSGRVECAHNKTCLGTNLDLVLFITAYWAPRCHNPATLERSCHYDPPPEIGLIRSHITHVTLFHRFSPPEKSPKTMVVFGLQADDGSRDFRLQKSFLMSLIRTTNIRKAFDLTVRMSIQSV